MKQQSCFLALWSSHGDYSANRFVFSLPGEYFAFLVLTDEASCLGCQAVQGSSLQSDLVYLCRKKSSGEFLLSKHHKPFIQVPLILSLADRYISYITPLSLLSLRLWYHIFHFRQTYLTSFQTFSDVPLPAIHTQCKLYLSLAETTRS